MVKSCKNCRYFTNQVESNTGFCSELATTVYVYGVCGLYQPLLVVTPIQKIVMDVNK